MIFQKHQNKDINRHKNDKHYEETKQKYTENNTNHNLGLKG